MKKVNLTIITALVLFLPVGLTFAAGLGTGDATGGSFGKLLKNILDFANGVLIPFIIGIGFLVFVWGMFQYFIAGGANDEAKEKGKSLMIYATLGFVLIIVFWGIVNLLASSTGLEDTLDNDLTPKGTTIPGPKPVAPVAPLDTNPI